MRPIASIVLGVLAGCGGPPSVGVSVPESGPGSSRRDDEDFSEWLPAGLYFRGVYGEQRACDGCAQPRWAVAIGPFATGEEATAAVERAKGEHLPPGYPWAVHTDALSPRDESLSGILVILGLFEAEEPARWHCPLYGSARVLPLAPTVQALARLEARLRDPSNHARTPWVIQIDGGPPARAHAREDIERLRDGLDPSANDGTVDAMMKRAAALEQLAPRCEVAADSVHSFVENEHAERFDDFAPVRCSDGRIAYVHWARTRLRSVVRPLEGEAHRIVQSVLLECGVPLFEEWSYDRSGRHELPPEAVRLVARGSGCGPASGE